MQVANKEQITAVFSAASWLPQNRKFFREIVSGRMAFSEALSKLLDNLAERGIRKLKIKQKISGTFRSDLGADAFMAIHSIADTAWKNKKSPFEAILAVLQ